ncbi:unnamed protein product [Parajaminaea phylloscopi]
MARFAWLSALIAVLAAADGLCDRRTLTSRHELPHAGISAPDTTDRRPSLSGRFLHLTDLHPDPHYKPGSVASSGCHVDKPKKDKWRAGYWGTPVSGCDSPTHLVERSVQWVSDNWMPSSNKAVSGAVQDDDRTGFDFIIWTGDSARHDIDSIYPRTRKEIYDLNRWCLDLIHRSFPGVPVVPNIGNNDIFPHNIMWPGPSDVISAYSQIWSEEIPEYQLHTFQLGGYFSREVIPNRLAVISLNTLYFYDSNKVVDGCKRIQRERKKGRKDSLTHPGRHESQGQHQGGPDETGDDDDDDGEGASYSISAFNLTEALLKTKDPGTVQLLWLEAQLYQYHERGMGVHIIGHVPPTAGNYFPRCYDAYTDIVLHYQETVVGQHFGHMNIDAFFVQEDTEAVKREERRKRKRGKGKQVVFEVGSVPEASPAGPETQDDVVVSASLSEDLRKDYALLSGAGRTNESYYHFFFAAPGTVPTFLPSVRIWTYNTTGLTIDGAMSSASDQQSLLGNVPSPSPSDYEETFDAELEGPWRNASIVHTSERYQSLTRRHRRPSHGRKHKHRKSPLPRHASEISPARKNQALSMLGYSEWVLNLDATNKRWEKGVASHRASADGDRAGVASGSASGNASTFRLDFQLEYATYTPEALWGDLVQSKGGRGKLELDGPASTAPVPRHLLRRELRRRDVKLSDIFYKPDPQETRDGALSRTSSPKLHLPKPIKKLTDWRVDSITVSNMLRLARRLAVDDKMWGRYRERIYGSSGYKD